MTKKKQVKERELWGRIPGETKWEYIDTIDENNSLEMLVVQYRQAFGNNWQFEARPISED